VSTDLPAGRQVPPSRHRLRLPLIAKQKALFSRACGAKDEIRTRDPDLGKVVLYQLSYFRLFFKLSQRTFSADFVNANVSSIFISTRAEIIFFSHIIQ
jgi:hypothetical protein